jgi:N-acyl-D-aspartate/D-glutamate deacylase
VVKLLGEVNDGGAKLTGQIFPRPVGMILAHNLSWNPFTFCPSFADLAKLSDADRLVELRKPEVRAKLVAEEADLQLPLAKSTRDFTRIFPLGSPPNYEPTPEDSVEARAARAGVSPFEWAYDYLLEEGGKAQLLLALGNFVNGSLDQLREMMDDPNLIFGLGDGGAHYGLICDASFPTHVLSHWVRDRSRGLLPIGQAIATLTRRPAETVGLHDRGLLAPGYKADVNVIDPTALALHAPTVVRDLPGGGRRLMQTASGYKVSIVSGKTISRDGVPTGELPGKLVRGAKEAPVLA